MHRKPIEKETDCICSEFLAYQGHWTDPMKLTSTEPICSQELLNAADFGEASNSDMKARNTR